MSQKDQITNQLDELAGHDADWPDTLALLEYQQDDEDDRMLKHVVINMEITPRLHWLEGHFPETPLLPGVVQTHWAGVLSQQLVGDDKHFAQCDNVKFLEPILPGNCVMLTLTKASALKVRFQYAQEQLDEKKVHSTGTITFQEV